MLQAGVEAFALDARWTWVQTTSSRAEGPGRAPIRDHAIICSGRRIEDDDQTSQPIYCLLCQCVHSLNRSATMRCVFATTYGLFKASTHKVNSVYERVRCVRACGKLDKYWMVAFS
eukprot:m.116026 g.116026  ORF g.116026 m.116026 type:complete len:116 (-) comp21612_c0_seq1:953-1300(-)